MDCRPSLLSSSLVLLGNVYGMSEAMMTMADGNHGPEETERYMWLHLPLITNPHHVSRKVWQMVNAYQGVFCLLRAHETRPL